MLSLSSINAALGTVTAWQRTQYGIVPKPESVLAKLNEHTRFNGLVDLSDADNVDTEKLYQSLDFVANGIDPNAMFTTEHSVVMDDTVKFLIDNVRRYLMHTKTVAAVAIDELITQFNEKKESWISPESQTEIVLWTPPKPLLTDSLKNMVDGYLEETPYAVPIARLINEPANYAIIKECLKTGIDELDEAVEEWFGCLDQYTIESLWNTFYLGEVTGFIGKEPVSTKDNDIWDYFRNTKVGYDCALFVYLMSTYLTANKHPDSAVSLNVFETKVANYLSASAIALAEQIEKINRECTTGVLVRDLIAKENKVIVNESVFEKWVEDETNGVDLLLAFGLADVRKRYAFKSIFTVDEIEEEKQILAQAWVSEMTNARFRNSNYQLRCARNLLYHVFSEQLDRIPESLPDADNEGDVREHYTQLRKGELLGQWKDAIDNELRFNDLENIEKWIMVHVCKIRFPGRPCLELLEGIDIALDNEQSTSRYKPKNLSPDEAAFMSVFLYLTRWFIGQLTVSAEWRTASGTIIPENVSRHAMTAATISNMVEIISQTMNGLGGNLIASTLGGSLVTPEQIGMMIVSELMTTYSHIKFMPDD